ncbi:MAG: response regulator [Anaerolineae bacterium]|jgi:DNA-binding response OmpR family regulator|nr:response regulator [Anaerolineae bacterium]
MSEQKIKTILLIEDDADCAKIEMRALKPSSYRLLHAPDGTSGLLMAMQEKPDLILLDLGLPDVDGRTLASLIRRGPDLTRVPIIAVTAWPPDVVKRMMKACCCDGYICKPISPREFPSQVAAHLRLVEAQREDHSAD